MNTSKKNQLFYNIARLILVLIVVATWFIPHTAMAQLDVPVTAPVTPPVTPPIGEELTILTTSLPNGKIGRSYRGKIDGASSLTGQNLVFSANDMPLGLTLDSCTTKGRYNTSITCLITGNPQQSGTFTIELVLLNQMTGQAVNKSLLLQINDSGQ